MTGRTASTAGDGLPVGILRAVLVAVAVLLVAGMAVLVLAGRGSEQGPPRGMTGTVVSVDATAQTVCVAVDGLRECGHLVVPPGSRAPTLRQRVVVTSFTVDGRQFLVLPPSSS